MHRPLMSITAASIGIAILVAGAAAFQPGAATDAGRSIVVSGGAAADAEATPHDHAAMAMETEPMPHAQAHSSPDADGAPTMHAHSPNPGATAEPTAHLHAAGAGDATEPMPAAGARAKKHRHGLVDPTAEEIACGNDLVERTREATARLADFDAAVAEGYRGNPNNPEGTHFGNAMYHRDGAVLDLARPEALVYWKNPATGERVLLGALFKAPRGQAGPQPCGAVTWWHTHTSCVNRAARDVIEMHADGACPDGYTLHESVEMMHVWFIPGRGNGVAPHPIEES